VRIAGIFLKEHSGLQRHTLTEAKETKCKHLLRSLLKNLEVIDFFPNFALK
jgi:hypothetical protein